MTTVLQLQSKLQYLGTLNPAAWDSIHPHSHFVFSEGYVNLLAADLVRQISAEFPDETLRTRGFGISQQMARAASADLGSNWEPGDEICPPLRWPMPLPHGVDWFRPSGREPQPAPWKPVPSAVTVQLAYQLTQVAALTSDAEASQALLGLATGAAVVASRSLEDDFARCGTKPRAKFPGKGTVPVKTLSPNTVRV